MKNKILIVGKLNSNSLYPKSSSHLLFNYIVYALVGLENSNVEADILIDPGSTYLSAESDLYNLISYGGNTYEDKITELSVNKYDSVILFDYELFVRSENLPISNLIYIVSYLPINVNDTFNRMIKYSWVKLISMSPEFKFESENSRSMIPVCYYLPSKEVIKEDSDSINRILVFVDGSDTEIIDPDRFNKLLRSCHNNYPDSSIMVAKLGSYAIPSLDHDIECTVIAVSSLSLLYEILLQADLAVVYEYDRQINLYPFIFMSLGCPVAFLDSNTRNNYPYIIEDLYFTLDDSIMMNAYLESIEERSKFIASTVRGYDEPLFNSNILQLVASLSSYGYREEYRTPFEEILKSLNDNFKPIKVKILDGKKTTDKT